MEWTEYAPPSDTTLDGGLYLVRLIVTESPAALRDFYFKTIYSSLLQSIKDKFLLEQ